MGIVRRSAAWLPNLTFSTCRHSRLSPPVSRFGLRSGNFIIIHIMRTDAMDREHDCFDSLKGSSSFLRRRAAAGHSRRNNRNRFRDSHKRSVLSACRWLPLRHVQSVRRRKLRRPELRKATVPTARRRLPHGRKELSNFVLVFSSKMLPSCIIYGAHYTFMRLFPINACTSRLRLKASFMGTCCSGTSSRESPHRACISRVLSSRTVCFVPSINRS